MQPNRHQVPGVLVQGPKRQHGIEATSNRSESVDSAEHQSIPQQSGGAALQH
uniref:Uncharacterized protein n=1 Tax=Macrostomum lignano TaxID=282301 RepID=A0A1I8GGP8_9PLAT